jgi:hypothetical protein
MRRARRILVFALLLLIPSVAVGRKRDRPRRRSPGDGRDDTFTYRIGKMWQNGVALAASGRTHGGQFLDDANMLDFDAYRLLDLAVSYSRGPAFYSLNISNVTDTSYWASIRGQRQFYPGEPLRVKGTVRMMFR